MTSASLPAMQIFISIGSVGSSPKIGELLPPCAFFDCPVLCCPRSYAQVEPLERFSRFMAQTTCFPARIVLLGLERWVTIFGELCPQTSKKWAWIGNFQPKRQNIKITIYQLWIEISHPQNLCFISRVQNHKFSFLSITDHTQFFGPCTYRHFNFPLQMKNEKWKMDTQFHLPFFIANGKWKMDIYFWFFIFHLRWKIQNRQLKKPRKRQRISWSSGTITAEIVTYCYSAHRINLSQFSEKKNGWWGRHLLP